MNTIFSPDSRVMQLLNRASDLLIVNLLFVLTSLPVVTIGPALAALYHVVFTMGTVRETGVLRSYFRAFRENFVQAAGLWLLLLGVSAALALDWVLVENIGGTVAWMRVIFGVLMAVELLAAGMMFPLLSLFRNSAMGTLKNGLILGLGNLPRGICIAAMWLFPVVLTIYQPVMFPACAFAGLTFYFSTAAYGTCLLLRKVFQPWLPEELQNKEDTV